MPVVRSKIVGEEKAMAVAFEKIMIDGSNQEEIIELAKRYVTNDCEYKASVAEVLVVDAMFEKRIERAIEWLKKNEYDKQEALFTLGYEFVQAGRQFNRGVVISVLNEAMLRLNKITA